MQRPMKWTVKMGTLIPLHLWSWRHHISSSVDIWIMWGIRPVRLSDIALYHFLAPSLRWNWIRSSIFEKCAWREGARTTYRAMSVEHKSESRFQTTFVSEIVHDRKSHWREGISANHAVVGKSIEVHSFLEIRMVWWWSSNRCVYWHCSIYILPPSLPMKTVLRHWTNHGIFTGGREDDPSIKQCQ